VNWLSLETSSPEVSLALGEGEKCLRQVSRKGNASQIIEDLYKELNVDMALVEKVLISKGPGSYNGLRVGYGFLKGLLIGDARPTIEVPSPMSIGVQAKALHPEVSDLIVLNNARRDEVYAAWIDLNGGLTLKSEVICSAAALPQKFSPSLVVSYDYEPRSLPIFSEVPWITLFPRAEDLMKAASLARLELTSSSSALSPHYVRPPVPESKVLR
jgi:tRNA threonylcarbamoyl adenosine modification protein YeaZ